MTVHFIRPQTPGTRRAFPERRYWICVSCFEASLPAVSLDVAGTTLNLSVLKVSIWSPTSRSFVESEYIVDERASVSQLHKRWLRTRVQGQTPFHPRESQHVNEDAPCVISETGCLSYPRFLHPDFYAGNIYTDESGKLSTMIGEQRVCTAAQFIGASLLMPLDSSAKKMLTFPDTGCAYESPVTPSCCPVNIDPFA
jgi:hypothetical protein